MSIADAIREVKTKIDNVYKVLEEAGATIPEEKNLDNLQTTIESKPGGETVMAYYVDTEIAEGKKVLLTKVTNPVTPDSEFCNGFIPFIISNGVAYGSQATSVSNGTWSLSYASQISDGKIDTTNKTESGGSMSWGPSGSIQIRHSCNGGKNGVSFLYSGEGAGDYISGYVSSWCNCVGNSMSIQYRRKRTFLTEHYVLSCSPDTSNSHRGLCAFKFNDTIVEMVDITKSDINPDHSIISTYQGFVFEREEDNGTCIYWLHSNSSDNFDEVVLEKYVFETGTFETLTTPYFEGNALPFNSMITRFFQTKDYKYLIYKDGYVFLEYDNAETSPNADGVIIKEFPEQIKTAMGDRTIKGIQVFYDYYFALMLSDGTTLMCKYNWDIVPADKVISATANGGDYLQVCDVEEIEPFKVADSDTVYQRAFSENRDFWYLTMQGVSKISLDMNPAGQFEKEKITNSYFAYEPSSVRFNSTVLTGFMTGNTADDYGRTMIEVKTVTK